MRVTNLKKVLLETKGNVDIVQALSLLKHLSARIVKNIKIVFLTIFASTIWDYSLL
mgnify:CR=1 FL=1